MLEASDATLPLPTPRDDGVIGAVMPAKGIIGASGNGLAPEDFRFSRRARRFVLRAQGGDLAAHGVNVSDTPPFGEPGIMQQAELTDSYEPLLREVEYLARRHPGEFERLVVLLHGFVERGRLHGSELEELRSALELLLQRRPTGYIMEVRASGRAQASFWPHNYPGGVWYLSLKGQIGADERGIFFKNGAGVEYFRAQHFYQKRLGRGDYRLEDAESSASSPSPIVICDACYDPDGVMTTVMFSEVELDRFNFLESTGKLALQLHTMAKLGVVIGQPLLRVVCKTQRYLEIEG